MRRQWIALVLVLSAALVLGAVAPAIGQVESPPAQDQPLEPLPGEQPGTETGATTDGNAGLWGLLGLIGLGGLLRGRRPYEMTGRERIGRAA